MIKEDGVGIDVGSELVVKSLSFDIGDGLFLNPGLGVVSLET